MGKNVGVVLSAAFNQDRSTNSQWYAQARSGLQSLAEELPIAMALGYVRRLLRPGNALRQGTSDLSLLSLVFLDQFIGDVVFINIGHISDRLLADPSRGNDLDVVKPDIRIKSTLLSFLPQFLNTAWPGVVSGKRKENFVARSHRVTFEKSIPEESHDHRFDAIRNCRALIEAAS